jgi:hypothetical protein
MLKNGNKHSDTVADKVKPPGGINMHAPHTQWNCSFAIVGPREKFNASKISK